MLADDEPATFSDQLLATGAPDDVAVIEGPRSYTYSDLRAAAAKLAAEIAGLGLPPDARIGLLGNNSFFWVAAYLAAMKQGVVVPLSDKNSPADLAAQADWVGCSAILLDRRQLRRFGAAFGERPIVTDAALARSDVPEWPQTRVDPGADAALMFTSGTTSRPKAVRTTHQNLLANTTSIVDYLDLRASDRMLVILPFHYVFGASLLHTHLAVGGSLVLCNTFTFPETALDLVEKHRCTGFAGVPSSYQLLLRASSYANRPLPSLRLVQQAGGRLASSLIEELALAQPTSRVFVMYGQTEATARLSYLPPELLASKLGSIGRGIPGVNLRVLDDDGRPVDPGEHGEIVARGANISPGYYNDSAATAEKFPGGELLTGDLATVDDEGFIFIVGRRGDFIKSWGYRISPAQIEEVAVEFPGVGAATAMGIPDAEAGEAVTLAVTVAPKGDLDLDALKSWLRRELPKHMVPEAVHVLTEFPLTASGKVAKPQLQELLRSL